MSKKYLFLEKIKSKKVNCDKCQTPKLFSELKKIDYLTRYCKKCYYEEINNERTNNFKK